MEDETNIICRSSTNSSSTCIANDLEKKCSTFDVQDMIGTNKSYQCYDQLEPLCHVKLDSILKLKASTNQLIYLLEEIQTKIHTKKYNQEIPDDTSKFSNVIKLLPQDDAPEGILDSLALRKLQNHTKNIDTIFIEEEHDDCSVYRKLTRKCHCLNHPDYNDFVIHFNEDSKYTTSNLGEIIKNMRILRKFLYMGGNYTKSSLMFLNEALAACFLYKLAELEEGRRYLNYSNKITNDIKKLLRKKSAYIEIDTIEYLNATLNLLKPVFTKNGAITYYNKSLYEGVGKSTINDLVNNRQYMTLDEIVMHLELLKNYSAYDSGKTEIMLHLPLLLILLKHLLLEYDNSEINIKVTNILNNMICKNMVNNTEPESSKSLVLADTATEAIHMKNAVCQIPLKKGNMKKINKSKCGLGISPNKFRQQSKIKDIEWEPPILLSKSKKFKNEHLKKSIIFVPIEK